jgi:hypothetical protein
MNAFKVFSVKTATEMVRVISAIKDTETREKVISAFRDAEEDWTSDLVAMVGDRDYEIIREYLKRDIPGVED